MKLEKFLENHMIRTSLFPHKENYSSIEAEIKAGTELVDCIVDAPFEFVALAVEEGYSISRIIWWDKVLTDVSSDIGAGGYADTRDPQRYYFAEITFLDKEFDASTPVAHYQEYMKTIFAAYPNNNLYPGFNLAKA